MPIFGKKPPDSAASDANAGVDTGSDFGRDSSLVFTQLGDMGRALQQAAQKIHISENSAADDTVEEAAILYASGNDGGARAVLEAAVAGERAGADELWQMLFDLYRLTNAHEAFDTHAVAYAQRFERSPPAWQTSTPVAAPVRDSAPAVNLSGHLTDKGRAQFEQLARIGAKNGKLRIDLSRLRGIDESGADLLMETVDNLRRARVKVSLLGARTALTLLEGRLRPGEREGRSCWLLTLALLQQMAEMERFDQVALDYAITFEESPPAYEPPESTESLTASVDAIERKLEMVDRFELAGEITGGGSELLRKLAAFASERDKVELDASALRRIDFVSAGSLLNQLLQLQGQGKLAVIRHPNALVAALLRIMGVGEAAQIEMRPR